MAAGRRYVVNVIELPPGLLGEPNVIDSPARLAWANRTSLTVPPGLPGRTERH
jgi:hypothetical protein